MNYRKIGGLHFIRIGRFGFNWYWTKRKPEHIMTVKLKGVRPFEIDLSGVSYEADQDRLEEGLAHG